MEGELAADEVEPRWRVRRSPLPWWRRIIDRKLAQADVTAPDGSQYHVRVLRNLPIRGTPLGPLDNALPQHVSLAVLVGANLYARGRTGWSIEVARAETPWRASHGIYTRRVRGGADVADVALALASAVQHGDKPWDDDQPGSVWTGVKKIMNWD